VNTLYIYTISENVISLYNAWLHYIFTP